MSKLTTKQQSADRNKGSSSPSLLPTFLSLLSARHEYNYDILVWALQHYLCSRFHDGAHPLGKRVWDLLEEDESETEGKESKETEVEGGGEAGGNFTWPQEMKKRCDEAAAASKQVKLPDDVRLFLEALLKHTRASPAMIRYGAALSLLATIHIYGPVVFDTVPALINAIISGCLDSHHLASSLYLKMMNVTAKLKGVENVERMTRARLGRFLLLTSAHLGVDRAGDSSASNNEGGGVTTSRATPSRHAVAMAALVMSPGLDPAYLLSLSAPLPFMKRNAQIAQMRLIEVWLARGRRGKGSKALAVSGDFVQNILPHLRSSDAEVQERAVAIFRKMAPWMQEVGGVSFPLLSFALLCFPFLPFLPSLSFPPFPSFHSFSFLMASRAFLRHACRHPLLSTSCDSSQTICSTLLRPTSVTD